MFYYSILVLLPAVGLYLVYVIVVSWAQVICLICTPKPEGYRLEGVGIHIRLIMRACDTTDNTIAG